MYRFLQLTWVVPLACWMALIGHSQESEGPKAGQIVETIVQQIEPAKELIQGTWTKSWIEQARKLPPIEARTLKINNREIPVNEGMFYLRYGSPLAYSRVLDLAEKHGFTAKPDSKVFDFGYGSLGHVLMLANSGLKVTAADVDRLLPLMYAEIATPADQAKVTLLTGKYPADAKLVEQAGTGYDLVLSKNTLKLGYVHPQREVENPRTLIDLGVSDDEFLDQISKILNPGGLFVIYNFCPAKAPLDKPYTPWADGESPFTQKQFEAHGFEVIAFDIDDNTPARALGHAIGWDGPGGMDLEKDLFAWYTIVKKR